MYLLLFDICDMIKVYDELDVADIEILAKKEDQFICLQSLN